MSNFKKNLINVLGFKKNKFHPLVITSDNITFGQNVYIGAFSEIYSKNSNIKIGDNCDIASFVSINSEDSHKKTIGIKKKNESKRILIGKNVFIGSHSFIKGGTEIGNYSVVAAGSIVGPGKIPPYSLVYGNPMKVKKGYYKKKLKKKIL